MYSFQLSTQFLKEEEKEVFSHFLKYHHLDENIWQIFECLFDAGTKYSTPILIKAYKDGELFGAGVVIRCRRYGKSIFKNNLLSGITNAMGIPFYFWIKVGCCMDLISNPGFVKDPKSSLELYREMSAFLSRQNLLTLIYDYKVNAPQYPAAGILPSLPHALIETKGMSTPMDYLNSYKNLKKKIRVFHNKGGTFELIREALPKEDVQALGRCIETTSKKSLVYLPYQDLNLKSAIAASNMELKEVYYFIARMNGQFLGYQAALKSGRHLNALHGAFDRDRPTTYHAYDILFLKMVEFAVDNDLDLIDIGAVLNITKQKMVNRTIDMSYFILSKYRLVQLLFRKLLQVSKVQGKEQMKFLDKAR